MNVIGHEHIGADPCAVLGSLLGKPKKSLVRKSVRKYVTAIVCSGDNEVSRRVQVQELETAEAWLLICGGHRPPLQTPPNRARSFS